MELTKQNLIDIIKTKEYIGGGAYGRIYLLNPNTLFKLYYKDVIETYCNPLYENIDKEIESAKEVYKIIDNPIINLITKVNNINKSKSKTLGLEVVSIEGILVGVIMNYFKDYKTLYEIYPTLTNEQKILILNKVKELLISLTDNNIYPRDIHEKNILVRKEDLDVQLIDLDDCLTRCEDKSYIETHKFIQDMVYDNESSMIRRLKLR